MSKLSKLLAKPEKITLEGEEFDIYPLTVENLELFLDMDDRSKRSACIKQIIKLTMKQAVPDATEDELKQMSAKYFSPLVDIILRVNGFEDESNSAIKERLAQQKELTNRNINN